MPFGIRFFFRKCHNRKYLNQVSLKKTSSQYSHELKFINFKLLVVTMNIKYLALYNKILKIIFNFGTNKMPELIHSILRQFSQQLIAMFTLYG